MVYLIFLDYFKLSKEMQKEKKTVADDNGCQLKEIYALNRNDILFTVLVLG